MDCPLRYYKLAGAGGFEPTNAGSKDRCLTTWLRPNANLKKLSEAGRNTVSLEGIRFLAC